MPPLASNFLPLLGCEVKQGLFRLTNVKTNNIALFCLLARMYSVVCRSAFIIHPWTWPMYQFLEWGMAWRNVPENCHFKSDFHWEFYQWRSSYIIHELCSVRPKTLFWFWFDTENETQNWKYFWADTVTSQNHISNKTLFKGRNLVTDHKRTTKTKFPAKY